MHLDPAWTARRLAMCVTPCCLAWLSACGASMPPAPTKVARPSWSQCLPVLPAGDLTVRQAEDLLEEARAALVRCDAQGRRVLSGWPD